MRRAAVQGGKALFGISTGAGIYNAMHDSAVDYGKYKTGELAKEDWCQANLKHLGSTIQEPITNLVLACDTVKEAWEKDELTPKTVVTAVSSLAPVDLVGMMQAGSNIHRSAQWMVQSHQLSKEAEAGGLTGGELHARQEALNSRYLGISGGSPKD